MGREARQGTTEARNGHRNLFPCLRFVCFCLVSVSSPQVGEYLRRPRIQINNRYLRDLSFSEALRKLSQKGMKGRRIHRQADEPGCAVSEWEAIQFGRGRSPLQDPEFVMFPPFGRCLIPIKIEHSKPIELRRFFLLWLWRRSDGSVMRQRPRTRLSRMPSPVFLIALAARFRPRCTCRVCSCTKSRRGMRQVTCRVCDVLPWLASRAPKSMSILASKHGAFILMVSGQACAIALIKDTTPSTTQGSREGGRSFTEIRLARAKNCEPKRGKI